MHAKFLLARGAYRSATRAGFTIVEAIIAVGIIGVSLGAMVTLNGQQLRMVKVSRDVNAATLYQQERVEQLRQLRWPDLASATYIANTYIATRPRSKAALGQISETIRIAPYPKAAQGGTPLKVTQTAEGPGTVDATENGLALENERLVRIDMQLKWKGADGRQQERSTVTLISNGGVTRSNLPAMGPVAGGPFDAFSTPTPTGTPVPGAATPTPKKGRGKTNGQTGQG